MEERIGTITETKAFEQLGILVLDGSGSMKAEGETQLTKAEEVDIAVRGLISRLKHSRNRDNFLLAVITYDDTVDANRLEITPVPNIDENADYNPLHGHGNATAMGDALHAALLVAEQFISGQMEFPRSAVIILMTDGQSNCGKYDAVDIAEEIKKSEKRITICTAGYGKGEDVDALTLQKIASDASSYVRAYDPEVLRRFFEASISRIRG